jgi:hypothetical protein
MARLVMVTGILALTAVLLTGCGGGGDDHAKVEASLQRYLVSLTPEDAPFPIGAGPPRVNRCWVKKDLSWPGYTDPAPPRQGPLWQCVVEFETFAMPATVAVDDSNKVVAAVVGGTVREIKPFREIKPK